MFEIAHRPRLLRAFAGPLTLGTLVTYAAIGGGAGCTRSEGQANLAEFSAFKDVDSAPAAIKKSAAAVFRIRTANAYGTGSFISSDGLILTNNHVAGIDVCALEGCYASLAIDHQRHSPVTDPVDVFLEPLNVNIGLDMAVLRAWRVGATGTKLVKLESPDYLTFEPRQAAELTGSKVFVVGHPEGRLKKWTTGEVADADGLWFRASAFSLPGNSGSPILNEGGHIVGLLHRGPSGEERCVDRARRDDRVPVEMARAAGEGEDAPDIARVVHPGELRFGRARREEDLRSGDRPLAQVAQDRPHPRGRLGVSLAGVVQGAALVGEEGDGHRGSLMPRSSPVAPLRAYRLNALTRSAAASFSAALALSTTAPMPKNSCVTPS